MSFRKSCRASVDDLALVGGGDHGDGLRLDLRFHDLDVQLLEELEELVRL